MRCSWPRLIAALASALLAGASLLASRRSLEAQGLGTAQQPVFRSGVQLIEVDVVATDGSGRPVMDLTKEEFELYDDGQRQEIAFFTRVSLPILAPHAPVLRDVANNAFAEDGRLFVLILDDIHSFRKSTPVIAAAARRLIERLSPQDQIAVLWMSTEKQGAFEFTTNHAAVLAAIDAFRARKAQVGVMGGIPSDADVPDSSPGNLQAYFERLRPFSMVEDLCNYLASIPRRRKAIVYVGQGPAGALLSDQFGRDTQQEVVRAVKAARRANVALYVIDPSGPLTPGAEGYLDETGPLSFRDLVRIRQNVMASFGEATGGFWGTGTHAVDLIDHIVTDTSNYYLLGYYPPPPTSRAMRWWKEVAGDPWARFRSLEVRTTRGAITIRARKGYWQDDALPRVVRAGPALSGTDAAWAVSGVLPRSALPLRAVAVPFRGQPTAKKHPLAIAVEVTARPHPGQAEHAVLFAAAAEPGKGVRMTDRVSASFGAGVSEDALSRYLLCARLDVEPGRYQLRLGVDSSWAQKTGSVYVDVTVPDYRKEVLSMSGLVLDQRSEAPPIPAVRASTITPLIPSPPALARQFAPADLVWTNVEIYRGVKAPAAPVEVITAVGREGEEAAVWHARESFPVSAFGPARKVVSRVMLPIAALAPGQYRLRILATVAGATGKGDPPTARRELDFEVTSPIGGTARSAGRSDKEEADTFFLLDGHRRRPLE